MIKPEKEFACLLWGGYAKGNTGDELCLAAALDRKQREFDGRVAILSPLPGYTAQLFPQATVISCLPPDPKWFRLRKRFFRASRSLTTATGLAYFMQNGRCDPGLEWMRTLACARQLYLVGGAYLTDLFPLDLALPPIQFALQRKIPVATAPIGIGPFEFPLNADKIAALLRPIKLTVRDQTSLEFCRARGIHPLLAPDDAFALVKDLVPPMPAKPAGPRRQRIGVCIFTQYGQDAKVDLTGWWTEILRGLKAQHPECEIEGFCFHTSLQAEFQEMTRLFPRAGLPVEHVQAPVMDFREAVGRVRGYDLVISTRFHATVTANAFNIPNVAIAAGNYYQSKMSAARLGFESISQLVNPAGQPPQDLLDICKRKLAGCESGQP